MGSGMPEIGSRISLISKADIRYEGKLFSVDPEECTIALSSVRSYGTEDRETAYPVPAQSQVYDYILFRGTDIKDIRVLSTTIPNDPAIVQLSVPPSLNESQFQSRTGYPQPPMAPMMPNVPGTSRDQSQGFPSSFAGAAGTRITAAEMMSKSQPSQNVASEDDSRSSTPSNQHAKNTDSATRVSTGSNKDEQNHQAQKKLTNNYNRDKPQSGNRYQQAPRQQYQQRYPQQSRYQNHQSQQQQQPPRYMQQQQQLQYRDYNRDNQYRNYNDYRDSYGSRQYVQPLRNQQRDGWNNYDQRRNNNRMGQNGQQRGSYQSGGYQNQNRKPRNTLKFEDDYDFEQANSEFEQMRSQLEKAKLDDTTTTAKVNGDVESKKEDSGNEVVSGEENDPDNEDKPIFYDKVKSFFDQISYEAIERSKGLTARMDWKTERKINSETFGTLALRRNSNFHGGRVGQNAGGYYNYQNRNPTMANNNYRGRYRQQQPNQRRPYNNVANKSHETAEARTT